ncbi:MAG: response regulator transcription factor [Treponema sp.]|nr:response regulator transcription factor [Treponema sp.]
MEEKKPYVFVIEDEESISKLVCMYLEKSEITPEPFYNAEDALKKLSTGIKPDLLILDLNLPGMSGFEFLKQFREMFSASIPVMIVSARDADEDIINGLNTGADEFVTKPFSPSVLVARVQASLRRKSNSVSSSEETINFGDFSLLLNSCVLKKEGNKIPLSTKEYEVLEYLVKNAGTVLSPEKIYNDVWKVQYGDITAVAVYIQRLRKKLESNPSEAQYIKTEFGKGYIFNKDLIKS